MIPGVRGRLVTASFARDVLPGMTGFVKVPPRVSAQLTTWAARVDATLGPASSVRAIADVAVVPLLDLLGFTLEGRTDLGAFSTLRRLPIPCVGARRPSKQTRKPTRVDCKHAERGDVLSPAFADQNQPGPTD